MFSRVRRTSSSAHLPGGGIDLLAPICAVRKECVRQVCGLQTILRDLHVPDKLLLLLMLAWPRSPCCRACHVRWPACLAAVIACAQFSHRLMFFVSVKGEHATHDCACLMPFCTIHPKMLNTWDLSWAGYRFVLGDVGQEFRLNS